MTNISKTTTNCGHSIVFLGSGPVAAASLDFLADHFNIEAVVTKQVPPHHKGVAPVEELAKTRGLKIVFASDKFQLDQVIDDQPFCSEMAIVVDFGVIISEKVIQSFKLGIVNSHFSLLPEWRGADPITFAILSGQPTTGVSLMIIEPTLDTGKLIAQESLDVKPNETTPELTSRLIDLSNEMLLKFIPDYQEGKIAPFDQPNPEKATYSRKLVKSDGAIDWNKPAKQLEREIRAFMIWPGSKATIGDKVITVLKAHVTKTKEDKLDIPTGDNKYLSIDALIAPSGRKMLSRDFINGYKID